MTVLASIGLLGCLGIAFLLFICIIALVENEHGSWATGVILTVAACLYWTGGKNSFREFLCFMGDHIVGFVAIVAAYIVAGIGYSFWKWLIFVKESKEAKRAMPKASFHKARLIRWIAYWIFSIWWTLLNEPLKALVDYLGASYDKLAQKIYDKA